MTSSFYFLSSTYLWLILFLIVNPSDGSLPLVCWHGIEYDSRNCDIPVRVAKEAIPDLYAVKVQIGESYELDKANSVLMRTSDQVSYVCDMIRSDPRLSDGYNGLGISQGGLLMRGVLQRCPDPPMRNLITYGSPHQGVFGVPSCVPWSNSYELCELVRQLLSLGAYEPWIQDLVAPAQYWHDPFNQTNFLAGSHFLADINNELDEKNDLYKNALANLENLVLVMWDNDTTIVPKESSHFGFYVLDQDKEVLTMEELPIYKEDWIGLAALNSQEKLNKLVHPGDHMEFDWAWYMDNIVIPYLV